MLGLRDSQLQFDVIGVQSEQYVPFFDSLAGLNLAFRDLACNTESYRRLVPRLQGSGESVFSASGPKVRLNHKGTNYQFGAVWIETWKSRIDSLRYRDLVCFGLEIMVRESRTN